MKGAVIYRGLHGETIPVRRIEPKPDQAFPLARYAATLPDLRQKDCFAHYATFMPYGVCERFAKAQEERRAAGLPITQPPGKWAS